jgi:hypothetical protein
LRSHVPVIGWGFPAFVGAEKACTCFDWIILSISAALPEEKLSPEDMIYVRYVYLLGSISRSSDIISAVWPPDPRTITICESLVLRGLLVRHGREAKGRI